VTGRSSPALHDVPVPESRLLAGVTGRCSPTASGGSDLWAGRLAGGAATASELARWGFRFAGLLSRVNASRSGGYAARSGVGALRALFSALREEIWENLIRKPEKIWLDSYQITTKP